MSQHLTLITGGPSAGKTRYAQHLATNQGRVLYLATDEPTDPDLAELLTQDTVDCPAGCDKLRTPREIVEAVLPVLPSYDTVLVDGIGPWVGNLMEQGEDVDVTIEVDRLMDLIDTSPGNWIVVSSDASTGLGAEHDNRYRYIDALGRANQRIAATADAAYLLINGIPLDLKQLSEG